MNVVNWPLNKWFPDTFNPQRIETRARDMVDAAQGAWFIVLFIVVVIGAPLVEELVYRGFIQGGLQARLGSTWALIITAAWFTVVHLEPIEFPGLLHLLSCSVFVIDALSEWVSRWSLTWPSMQRDCYS